MVQTIKSNPTPVVTAAIVTPADMLKRTVQLGKATHTAALDFVYAAAAYILLVSHFKSTKDEGYLNRSDAREYLEKQLASDIGIGARMIYKYLSPADVLVKALTGKMFGPTVEALGKAKTPEEMTRLIASWIDQVKGKRHVALNDLHESLGMSHKKPADQQRANVTPLVMAERIGGTIERAFENVKGLKDSAVAQQVVAHVKSKSAFIVEAIKQVFEENDLKAIENAIKEQYKMAARLSSEAKIAAKSAAKGATTVKAAATSTNRGRGRQTTQRKTA